MELEEKVNAAWELPYDDEYSFWDENIDHISEVTWKFRPELNQGKNEKSASACTIFWAWNQILRLFQLGLTLEEANKVWLEIVDYCVKNWGYVVWEGWWVYTACQYVTKWWNEIWYKKFNKEKVFYIRRMWNDSMVLEALSKWHLVGYSKYRNFWQDQINGYVYRKAEDYPKSTWHRLNLKGVEYTKSTWWAERQDSKYGCLDNYAWRYWQEYFFKDIKTYINDGINPYVYFIFPVSYLTSSVEEEKEKIAELKAVNTLIWVLTTTWWDLPKDFQAMSADYAKELRKEYEWARPLYDDQTKKVMQSVVDMLSYSYKFANKEYQEKFATLAKEMRTTFNLK